MKYVNANMQRDKDFMLKCKILLPKFNTWELVHLERENGSEVPLFNSENRFLAKNHWRYGAIALPLRCNGNAISV